MTRRRPADPALAWLEEFVKGASRPLTVPGRRLTSGRRWASFDEELELLRRPGHELRIPTTWTLPHGVCLAPWTYPLGQSTQDCMGVIATPERFREAMILWRDPKRCWRPRAVWTYGEGEDVSSTPHVGRVYVAQDPRPSLRAQWAAEHRFLLNLGTYDLPIRTKRLEALWTVQQIARLGPFGDDSRPSRALMEALQFASAQGWARDAIWVQWHTSQSPLDRERVQP